MAERLAYLEAVVGADITQFRKGMRDIRNEVGILSETMQGLSAIGRTMTFAFTAPVVTLGTYAVQAAADFESSMRNVNSIAQLTEDQFDILNERVLDFGRNTRGGPVQAADALYTAYSAGINQMDTALQFMEIASRTAEAGLADLTTTTQALVASFLSYGGGDLPLVDQLAMVEEHADALTQMVQIGVGDMNVFATAIGRVVPAAVALDVSITDLYASVAFLTQRGLSAATSATSLNAALIALTKPSTAMTAAFRELGVASGDELIEKFGGLEEGLEALIGTAEGSTERISAIFQNKQALRAILLMMENIDAYKRAISDFNAGMDGATARAWEQQMESFAAKWDLLTSALQGAAITIGNSIIPLITPLVDGATDLLGAIGDLSPEVVSLGVAFLGVAAAAGPVLWLIGSAVTPVTLLVGALASLATAFTLNLGDIQGTVSSAVETIFGDLDQLKTLVDRIINDIFPDNFTQQLVDGAPAPVAFTPTDFVTVTVEAGDTLWDIWFGQFKDDMTWEAFLEAVNLENPARIHAGDIITVGGEFRTDMLTMLRSASPTLNEVISTIFGTMQATLNPLDYTAVIGDNLPNFNPVMNGADLNLDGWWETSILPVLQGIIERAANWFDTQAGMGIRWFAGLFEGSGANGGDTPIYTAVEALLRGNVEQAINAVIPGFGTTLSNAIGGWGEAISGAFPQIQKSVDLLIGNIGKWIVNEGVPTLARAAGNLGGRLVVSLYDAINGAIAFLTDPATLQGAGDIAGSVTDYFSGTLAPEFVAGWESAIAGTDFKTQGIPLLQNAIDSLGSIFDAVDLDALLQGFSDLGAGISDFANDLTSADWSGLLRALALIGGLAATIFNNGVGATLSGFGSTLDIFGDSLKNLLDGLADLTSGQDPGEALLRIAGGASQLGLALLTIPTSIIDSVLSFIERLTGIELGSLTEWVQQLSDQVSAALNGVSIEAHPLVTMTPNNVYLDLRDGVDAAVEQALLNDNIDQRIKDQIIAWYEGNPLTVGLQGVNFTVEEVGEAFVATDVLSQLQYALGGGPPIDLMIDANPVIQWQAWDAAEAPEEYVPIPSARVRPENITLDIDPTAVSTLTPEGQSLLNSSISDRLMNAVTTSGIALNPDTFENEVLAPLADSIVTYLGGDSDAVSTVTEFSLGVVDNLVAITDNFTTMNEETVGAVGEFTSIVTAAVPGITTPLNAIKLTVDALTGSLFAMITAISSIPTTISLPSVGGTKPNEPLQVDGFRAKGGSVRSGGTYVVGEEGPELFTAPTSGSIIPNDMLFGSSRESANSAPTYQTVNIYEVSNLDSLIYEARRRGIKL